MNLQEKISRFIEKSPSFQAQLAQELAEADAALRERRLKLVGEIKDACLEVPKLDKPIEVQRGKVEAARQAFERESAALDELAGRQAAARQREAALLTRLANDPEMGESDLEGAINLLDSGLRGIEAEIAEARRSVHGLRGRPEMGIPPDHRHAAARANVAELEQRRQALSAALTAANRLRLAPLGPQELAKQIETLMARCGINRTAAGHWMGDGYAG